MQDAKKKRAIQTKDQSNKTKAVDERSIPSLCSLYAGFAAMLDLIERCPFSLHIGKRLSPINIGKKGLMSGTLS